MIANRVKFYILWVSLLIQSDDVHKPNVKNCLWQLTYRIIRGTESWSVGTERGSDLLLSSPNHLLSPRSLFIH